MSLLRTGAFYDPEVGATFRTGILLCDLCGQRIEGPSDTIDEAVQEGGWLLRQLCDAHGEEVTEHHCPECRDG